jgi:hypothetical protein
MKSESGVIDMRFHGQEKDVFYYDVDIRWGTKQIQFLLPRYAPMVGWIEVFGLPPQNEWVVLDQVANTFTEAGTIEVKAEEGNFKIEEKLTISTDTSLKWRFIQCERATGNLFERQLYIEDWSAFAAKKHIRKYSVFVHSRGLYRVTIDAYLKLDSRHLSKGQKDFLEKVKKEHGQPTYLWLKRFSAEGESLPIYNKLFPFWGSGLPSEKGSSLEIGYEKELSHGDWYKLLKIGSDRYEIKEGSWSSRAAIWRGERVKIKNTYRKTITKL